MPVATAWLPDLFPDPGGVPRIGLEGFSLSDLDLLLSQQIRSMRTSMIRLDQNRVLLSPKIRLRSEAAKASRTCHLDEPS